jgi:hypothetical protein
MVKPTPPTAPEAPLRSDPAFSTKAQTFLTWLAGGFYSYVGDSVDFVDERADEALAAATTFGFPSIAGKALNFTRVNAGATALEFRTPEQVRSDLGITPLTNGVIIGTRWIQWGTFTPPNNSSQQWGVTFATAFPTACRAVVANIINNTVAIGTIATYQLTTTGFAFGQNWIGGQTGNLSIYWEAVGD